ncbi:MAG: class II aldolase/adducin family protein [Gemmataceae bacterium]
MSWSADIRQIKQVIRYARLVSRRGYVSNQLGNIAVRMNEPDAGDDVVYTKQRGSSLEDMTAEDVVALGLRSDRLLHGQTRPSVGYGLNREIFLLRPDVGCVIHVHIDEAIAYFSATGENSFRFVSADAAIVLAKPVAILGPEVNVERDASRIRDFIAGTNSFIMPNHGVTVLGSTAQEAYYRLTTLVAEVRRLLLATLLCAQLGRALPALSADEVRSLMALSGEIL